MTDEVTSVEGAELATTMPIGLTVTVHGINAPDIEPLLAEAVRVVVDRLGQELDLRTLDGVTVAADHGAAIQELDRGLAGLRTPGVTSGNAIGVAQTVNVVRHGLLKSHVFLGLVAAAPLILTDRSPGTAIHTIAHECAHVEVTAAFERCFPGHLVNRNLGALSEIRWDFALGCWDEYMVTRICATWGADATKDYETLFLDALADFPAQADEALRAFNEHGNRLTSLMGVLRAYGVLMQRAAYHLGNLDGHRRSVVDFPRTLDVLDSHWLGPYIRQFHQTLRETADGYGKWKDEAPFMTLATQYEDMLASLGVKYEQRAYRELWIDLEGALDRVGPTVS